MWSHVKNSLSPISSELIGYGVTVGIAFLSLLELSIVNYCSVAFFFLLQDVGTFWSVHNGTQSEVYLEAVHSSLCCQ